MTEPAGHPSAEDEPATHEPAARLRATRTAYDTVAVDYDRLLRDDLSGRPLERAMLAAFAEVVRGAERRLPVVEVGCGTGRITGHLRSLGLEVSGVDLSPGMVEVARRRHPGLRFEVGSMGELDVADGALGGVVAWYATVHTPPERLPGVFAEFARVLAPGGSLLLASKAGDRHRHLSEAYGHPLSLDVYWTPPERVEEALRAAGFVVEARMLREPDAWERSVGQGQQAYVLAHRPRPDVGTDGGGDDRTGGAPGRSADA
ncbi:class I SAM-dependent DNA methyltransferase [Streptomyces sp. 4N509B]|uniref:class I SAM-dependent DNA methyltransferase n=1 Tax=Streptomyces sp. 4N509B TaxID=3457413 RepID=UPI003FD4C4DC